MNPDVLAFGLVWYVVFLLSLTCHEAAHAWVAKLGGDPTAYEGGQVTLNPIPHIRREPFGTILAPLITFVASGWMMGWASAPYDPYWRQRHPRRAAWMALAGPAANFLLAVAAAIGIRIGLAVGVFAMPQTLRFSQMAQAATPGAAEGAAVFLSILFSLNVMLGSFNLLPLPPLDGHTGVGLLLSDKAANRFAALTSGSMLSLIGIVVAWRVFDEISGYVFRIALTLLYW